MLNNCSRSEINGWNQKCKICGFTAPYDQYNKKCSHCGSSEFEIYFICPICHERSEYGSQTCSGCQKDISYLISAPYLKSNKIDTKKKNHRKTILSISSVILFFGLTFALSLNIPLSLIAGLIAGLFCWF